ncbi:hypothetical protein [Sphingomonas sp. 35-24ZXX]|uniref:hypothetical protein n=1 Tax=Sphingomonas sp. 35-24ZXX TaxID=1545915 RepID=UPI00053BF359|nr:hypothetical protein [Sphingomonas sp. 35-24ZXX]
MRRDEIEPPRNGKQSDSDIKRPVYVDPAALFQKRRLAGGLAAFDTIKDDLLPKGALANRRSLAGDHSDMVAAIGSVFRENGHEFDESIPHLRAVLAQSAEFFRTAVEMEARRLGGEVHPELKSAMVLAAEAANAVAEAPGTEIHAEAKHPSPNERPTI